MWTKAKIEGAITNWRGMDPVGRILTLAVLITLAGFSLTLAGGFTLAAYEVGILRWPL